MLQKELKRGSNWDFKLQTSQIFGQTRHFLKQDKMFSTLTLKAGTALCPSLTLQRETSHELTYLPDLLVDPWPDTPPAPFIRNL